MVLVAEVDGTVAEVDILEVVPVEEVPPIMVEF